MFTGIVEETGTILEVTADAEGRRLRIETTVDDLNVGQSISVSGACLTVEAHGEGWFEVFLAEETVERTYLGELAAGDVVNIERALRADSRLDGHIVQGHVDGTATVESLREVGEDWRLAVTPPDQLGRYIVEKGSIAIDGISLTVAAVTDDTVEIAIVPETYAVTNLSEKTPGDPVHVEVDVIAKYVEQLTEGYTE
jgi:riboflavin synthase